MKKSLLLLILPCSFLMAHCFAQDPHIVDSLRNELKKHNHDTTTAKILNALSQAYWGSNPDMAMDYARQALSLSKQIGYKKGMGSAYHSMGVINIDKGDYIQAMEFDKNALKISLEIGNSKGVAGSYNEIGLIYREQGNYPEALKNLSASLKIRKEIGDKNGIAAAYCNIGTIYHDQGNAPEALKNHFTSLKIFKEIGAKWGVANSYNNIGNIYQDQGNSSEALKNYFASLKISEEIGYKQSSASAYNNIGVIYYNEGNYPEALKNYSVSLKIREEIGDKEGIASIYNNIGAIYADQGDYPDAVKNYFIALKIREEIGDKEGIANSYSNIGNIYTRQKKYIDASGYLNKSLSLSKEIGSLERIKESYKGLAIFDSAQGNFKQALEHYKLFVIYRDSLVNKENTRKITQQQMQYDFDKKQVADSLKFEKEKEVGALRLQRQKAFTWTGFAGVALTLLFLLFLYRGFRKQKRSNRIIEHTNEELHKVNNDLKDTQAQLVQQEKLASLGALTAGIAHEIKNPLNFVNNFAELSNELLEELKTAGSEAEKNGIMETLKQNLEKINHHGQRADGIVKSMLEHSRSGTGEKQSTDINKLCDEYLNLAYHGMRANLKDFNCTIERHFAENLPKLNIVPQDISRVLLNLINNAFYAIKDKPGATLTLTTLATANSVVIKIKDNGTGIPEDVKQKIFEPFFTTKPAGSGTGLGLSLSFDIIKAHGGKIEVDSKENRYTEFQITLPL
jgi:two-component system, NtrC family, sensor kinase